MKVEQKPAGVPIPEAPKLPEAAAEPVASESEPTEETKSKSRLEFRHKRIIRQDEVKRQIATLKQKAKDIQEELDMDIEAGFLSPEYKAEEAKKVEGMIRQISELEEEHERIEEELRKTEETLAEPGVPEAPKLPEAAVEPKEVKPASQPWGISEQDRRVLAEIREIVETNRRQIEERRERIEEIKRQEAEMEREIAELREQLAQKPAGDLEAEISQIQTELISNERKINFAGRTITPALAMGVLSGVGAITSYFLLPEMTRIFSTLLGVEIASVVIIFGSTLSSFWLKKKLRNLNDKLREKLDEKSANENEKNL